MEWERGRAIQVAKVGEGGIASYSDLYPQCPTQCLAHSRLLLNLTVTLMLSYRVTLDRSATSSSPGVLTLKVNKIP